MILIVVVWWIKMESVKEKNERMYDDIIPGLKQRFLPPEIKTDQFEIETIDDVILEDMNKKIFNEGYLMKLSDINLPITGNMKKVNVCRDFSRSGTLGVENIDLSVPWEYSRERDVRIKLVVIVTVRYKNGDYVERTMTNMIDGRKTSVNFKRKDFNERVYYDVDNSESFSISFKVIPFEGETVTCNTVGFPKIISLKNIVVSSLED